MKKFWAKITKKATELGKYSIQQGTYLGRVTDFFALFPYGMHANLPSDQLGLVIDEEGRVFLSSSAIGRITVEEGEVVFFHPATKSKTHYKASGDIDIDTTVADANINLNAKEVNVTVENVNITASGDANVKAVNVKIDATKIDLGVGGAAIARVGDAVAVNGTTHIGTITSGGANTSL